MDMHLFSLISDSHVSLVKERKNMKIKTKRGSFSMGSFLSSIVVNDWATI
jgi:hypothetical protein